MSKTPLCDPFVWENPKVLLYTGFTLKQHKDGPCASEMVNHLIFLYLVAAAIGAFPASAAIRARREKKKQD